MKTLREILLNEYREVNPRLDQVRAEVIRAEQSRAEAPAESPARRLVPNWANPLSLVRTLWRELFWSSRRAWAGLAAVWAGIIVFNFAESSPSENAAPRMAAARPTLTLASQQQQLKLIEQLTDSLTADFAEPTRPRQPRPRSDRRSGQRIG